jgi:hypothetical protein
VSVKNSLKGIGAHFLVTIALLGTETLIELFLHWNPSQIEKDTIDPIIKITNWFLIGTIAQFCALAFVILIIVSAEEVLERFSEFVAKIKGKSGVK